MILENNLGVLNTLYRAHESEFSQTVNGYKVGDTVSIRRPADPTVRTGATMSTQDIIEGDVALKVDQQIGVDFRFTSTELTLDVSDLSERVIQPAMVNIIEHMTSDVFGQFYQGVYNWVGTPGQTINSFTDFAKIPERMDEMSIPVMNRCAALSPADNWGLVGSQTELNAGERLVTSAYRTGTLGEVGGLDTYRYQGMPRHQTGVRGGTPLVNGASQNVTYDTAKSSWTQTLDLDGWTGSVTNVLRAGDVFTIAGVYMVNAKTKVATQHLQQFVVTESVNSTSSGATEVTISPPIISSGTHQTVGTAPADNAAVTILGAANTTYQQNLGYHKNAFALAVVPMDMPPAAYNGSRQSYKGYSVRVIPVYDGTNDRSSWRLDMLYGRRLIDPRLATRGSGTA